jgi:aspartyl-tRNA(Asn)/glutamyl-tRNA(Gln) amidotransferase subunit C
MKLTPDDVLHVAGLARLDIDPRTVDELAGQLAGILDYVDKLAEVDTENVPATAHAIDLTNAFREDVVRPHLSNDEALDNAPSREDGSFIVPRVI